MARDVERLLLVREVEEFLFHEARLLDERRFEDWMALFADDGVYWVPMQEGQRSPRDGHSIFHDDKAMMDVRIRRLRHAANYAQIPPSRTRHLIGNVVLDDEAVEDGEIGARSSLMMLEYRDEQQRVFAAACHHLLRRDGGGLRIVLKRVDLVNCDAAHGHLSVPF